MYVAGRDFAEAGRRLIYRPARMYGSLVGPDGGCALGAGHADADPRRSEPGRNHEFDRFRGWYKSVR